MSSRSRRNNPRFATPYERLPRLPPSVRLSELQMRKRDIAQSHPRYQTLDEIINVIIVMERKVNTERNDMLRPVSQAYLQNLFAAADKVLAEIFPPPPPTPVATKR